MFETFFGLPMHPLIVHATVVIVPTAAMVVLLAAFSARFRAWAGYLTAAVSALALVLVPLTTSTGESLESRLPESALIERHADLAEGLLPWVILLAVAGMAIAAVHRNEAAGSPRAIPRSITALVMAIALIGSIGTVVQVGRIGHSGAKASWSKAAGVPALSVSDSGDSSTEQ